VLVGLLTACTSVTTRVPGVTFDTEPSRPATKMLHPGARASVCRTTLLGFAIGGSASPLEAGLRALLATDPEADQLADVQIRERTVTTGLVDRTCITVQADVVRAISTVRLPAPAGHQGHH
jgi:hypothetical protein